MQTQGEKGVLAGHHIQDVPQSGYGSMADVFVVVSVSAASLVGLCCAYTLLKNTVVSIKSCWEEFKRVFCCVKRVKVVPDRSASSKLLLNMDGVESKLDKILAAVTSEEAPLSKDINSSKTPDLSALDVQTRDSSKNTNMCASG